MSTESYYLEPPGETVDPNHQIDKARDLADLLQHGKLDYAEFVECRKTDSGEIVVFDVEVELGQLKANDIRQTERISTEFYTDDAVMPEVLVLRSDFPAVPHINLQTEEYPRCLCLYDQPYRELKQQWTSSRFVERIRWWLARTAKGKLHGKDQPLEPLLISQTGTIVLPYAVTHPNSDEQCKPLFFSATSTEHGDAYFIATQVLPTRGQPGVIAATCVLSCEPQLHGVIRHKPTTLSDLAQLVGAAGLNLIPELRSQLKKSKAEADEQEAFEKAPLIIIVRFPKQRQADGPVESTDVSVFLTTKNCREVGIDIGAWCEWDGKLGEILEPAADQKGDNIGVFVLDPVYELNPTLAALLNGHQPNNQASITAIGAGALGSQVLMNTARAGFGKVWTVVDEDRVNPHNLVRHALDGAHIGFHKAEAVCFLANSLTPSVQRYSPVVAEVIAPKEKAEELETAFREADVILDMSASVSVARHIVHAIDSDAQRMSLFLNPMGDDLVLLAESKDREIPLDVLEMQYYRALINNEALAGHFTPKDDGKRYGQSCRDVTAIIPQESVALYSAIGAKAIRTAVGSEAHQITVWRSSPDQTVNRIEVAANAVNRIELGDWELLVDEIVMELIFELREKKLPRETGGVLLGSFDLDRKIAYVVDMIPSPPDSKEMPFLYIRGCKGLKRKVSAIHDRTDGMLHYVGEWHSHPDNCSTTPSDLDLEVFSWLTDHMSADGYPALMMIAGEHKTLNSFIAKMERIENLLPTL